MTEMYFYNESESSMASNCEAAARELTLLKQASNTDDQESRDLACARRNARCA